MNTCWIFPIKDVGYILTGPGPSTETERRQEQAAFHERRGMYTSMFLTGFLEKKKQYIMLFG